MPRTSKTKDRLLALAVKQLDERGETGLRVTELCREVRVPVTSLYHFFGSREGLVEAAYKQVYERTLERDLQRFREGAARCADATQFRRFVFETLQAYLQPEAVALRKRRIAIIGASYRRTALQGVVSAAQAVFLTGLAEVLDGQKAKGWVRAGLDSLAFTTWLHGQMLGEALVQLDGVNVTPEQWLKVSMRSVFALLFGDAPGTPVP